jgi:protein-S-isoprenylcysteine O-methyltransferase Ste14
MNNLNFRALRLSLLGTLVMAALLFIPAGTLNYWQAWLFMCVFAGSSTATTVYLAIYDPNLLERRMNAGPAAEKEPTQKVIVSVVMIGFMALLIFPGFDHRFEWSQVPFLLSLAGDALIVFSFIIFFIVFKVNTYGASTIQITKGQKVISTGPYAFVRHPMYAGALPLLLGMPLALGSWWGLFVAILFLPALIWRLLDEERFLLKHLPGYTDYCQKVHYHLVPFIW